MAKRRTNDIAQAALDQEDNTARLAQITAALDVVEQQRSLVISLENQLKQAKRLLKEKEWDAHAKIRQIAKRLKPTTSKTSAPPNGSAP